MFEPKVIAIGASAGFVLSFLIGLFSRASFPIVLLRAFFMAILSGFLTVMVRMVISRYLPELLQPGQPVTASPADTGNTVDITIDGNDRDPNPFERRDDMENPDMVPDFISSGERDNAGENSRENESREFIPMYGGEKIKAPQGQVSSGSSAGIGAQPAGQTVDGLDILPDLQDFIPQTHEEEDENAVEEDPAFHDRSSERNSSLFRDSDMKGSTIESETMVKAIRTILSREN